MERATDRMTAPETRLQMAKRHVLEGRRIVERQKRLIEFRRGRGLDTSQSEDLLRAFERSMASFEDDLADIVAESGGPHLRLV
jgi:hypothetical protein